MVLIDMVTIGRLIIMKMVTVTLVTLQIFPDIVTATEVMGP